MPYILFCMRLFHSLLLSVISLSCLAQAPRHQSEVYLETRALAASNNQNPFWLRANQFGTVPLAGATATLRAGVGGSYLLADTTRRRYVAMQPLSRRPWTLHYQIEGIGNVGQSRQLLLPSAYVRLQHRRLTVAVGRWREVVGIGDTLLTSGFYGWSGNTLPIPRVQIGTNGFAPISKNGRWSVFANIAHGWFANTDFMQHSYLHQKTLMVRWGKPTARFRFTAGLNHFVQWAGHSSYLPKELATDGQLPNQLADFPNVLFLIRTNGRDNPRITSFDYYNLYGNHLGSSDMAFDITLPRAIVRAYYQHAFDDSSGLIFFNLPDGLYGISLQPTSRIAHASFRINRVLLEFLTTLNQSGATFWKGDGVINGGSQWTAFNKGADNYFNNGQYQEGWTYRNQVIGTPFITQKSDVRHELRNNTTWRINNNRVQVWHAGLWATVAERIDVQAKLSLGINRGVPGEPLPNPVQCSSVIQMAMPVGWLGGSSLTAAVAADIGQLYPTSIGGQVGLRRAFRLANR